MKNQQQTLDLFSQSSNPKRQKVPVYRVKLVRERSIDAPRVQSPQEVAEVVSDFLKGADREHFVVVMLSAANRVIGLNTAHVGSLTASIVSVREVFKPAILANAASIVVAHNHPSGNLEPSREDIRITRRLYEAGRLLDIKVLDSLVLGYDGAFTSLAKRGIIDSG